MLLLKNPFAGLILYGILVLAHLLLPTVVFYLRLPFRPGETVNEGRILQLVTEDEPEPEYRRELAQQMDFSKVTFIGEEVCLENYCELGKEQTGPFFPTHTDMDRIISHSLQLKKGLLNQTPDIITLKFDRK